MHCEPSQSQEMCLSDLIKLIYKKKSNNQEQ